MVDPRLFNLLRATLDRIPIVDTHEVMGFAPITPAMGIEELLWRIMPREAARLLKRSPGVGSEKRRSRFQKDYQKLPAPALEPQDYTDITEVKAFLTTIKNTQQYRYVIATFADLFDFNATEITDSTWPFLTQQIVSKSADPAWAEIALFQKANIEVMLSSSRSLTPKFAPWTQGHFVPLFWVDHFLFAATSKGRRLLEQRYNVVVKTVDDLLALIDRSLRTAANNGFVGLKSRLASFRTLHIENVDATLIKSIFAKEGVGVTPDEVKKFQDFVFHAIVQCSIMHKLPIQIDAGVEAASAESLERANPLHLTDMIFNYADARFVILYGGFPFTGETAVMTKTFPNIYLDGSWFHRTSIEVAKATLHEWLEVVPCGKIMLWGGNARSPEASYASLLLVKDILAEVLAEKVEDGYFTESLAVDIAWRLLRENAKAFYKIDPGRMSSLRSVTSHTSTS